MSGITVSGIYCYPLKSARGFSVDDWFVGRMGLVFDRQWMVIDERGMFVAQREHDGLGVGIRNMSLIRTSIEVPYLVCAAPGMDPFRTPLSGTDGEVIQTQVWKTECIGIDQGDEAARWFTEFLSRERRGQYRLVRMPDDQRIGYRNAKRGPAHVGYADADTFLIASQPSLDDLNSRMGEPLGWDRFRPSLVFDGCEPYAEDRWGEIEIGHVYFTGTKECVRCPITTQNQDTTERGKEPLATLATYRRVPHEGVIFGMNFVHRGSGIIKVGDPVRVIAQRKSFI